MKYEILKVVATVCNFVMDRYFIKKNLIGKNDTLKKEKKIESVL